MSYTNLADNGNTLMFINHRLHFTYNIYQGVITKPYTLV